MILLFLLLIMANAFTYQATANAAENRSLNLVEILNMTENENYTLTGKNSTIPVGGILLPCCPTPWVPKDMIDTRELPPDATIAEGGMEE